MRIQPKDEIGPNNTGKMILRGMFIGISDNWLYHNRSISSRLLKYLENRCGEVSPVTLNLLDWDPGQATEQDVHFVRMFIREMKALERDPVSTMNTSELVSEQRDNMLRAAALRIQKYQLSCLKAGIKPKMDLIENAKIIMANLATRKPASFQATKHWSDYKSTFEPTEKYMAVINGKAPKQVLGSGESVPQQDVNDEAETEEEDDRLGYTAI